MEILNQNKEQLRQIFTNYDPNAQMFKLGEECAELSQGIHKYAIQCVTGEGDVVALDNSIKEELADVLIMAYQINEFFYGNKADYEHISNIIKNKIDRQLGRIEKINGE